ncbi:MAG TPA: hypothetical protein VHG91_05135 [Longimicrobium sp.]|nr:hypothetical protein [Longimicrobium sp.]
MAARRWGEGAAQGRLAARPGSPSGGAAPGLERIALARERDALLYVPPGVEGAAPLAVMLHGAGGSAQSGIAHLMPLAGAAGLLLLAPDSVGRTWDVLEGGFGPDVATLDALLEQVFARCAVDAARLAIGGFSDGASYALSLGIGNGDLFTHVVAFSPGFMAHAAQVGAPRLFVSHGARDAVLPIDRCSRRIVPRLQRAGYDVEYVEFDGPHTVPEAVARRAVEWFGEEKS